MKPYHSAIYGGWGIESRHGDTLVEPGEFDSENSADSFARWCFDQGIDDNDIEGHATEFIEQWLGIQEEPPPLDGRRCPDCGDFDCPADPGF